MNDFIKDFNKCCEIAMLVRKHCYDIIHSDGDVEFPYNPNKSFNFKIVLPRNKKVHSVSVSIPPDANRDIHLNKNDIIDLNVIDWVVYETALFDHRGRIIYDDKLYSDGINRFDSISELIEEIKTIIENVNELN